MEKLIFDIIGYLGAFFCLLGFFLLSRKTITSNSKAYNFLNLIGGLCCVINAIYYGSVPLSILDGVWTLISLYGILKK